jgi:curli biogenesis system outer membrane secretion channel CsgG
MRKMILAAALFAAAAVGQEKRRIAVMDFDYAAIQGSSDLGNVDVGKSVANLLVDRLVAGGAYSVIDRKALDKIIAEQNVSNGDRADPSSAARIGKLISVSAIVVGTISQFGTEDRTSNAGGSQAGGLTGRFGVGGVSKKQTKAVVQMSARIVNTETGEILAVVQGRGESTRSSAAVSGSGGGSTEVGGGAIDMGSSNFASTTLGEAVNKAVAALATQLNQSAAKLPVVAIKIEGVVADVSGATLIVNVGSKAGVSVGDRLQVTRAGREIKDPVTGNVLRHTASPVGEVVITEVEEGSSSGTFTGAMPPVVGDLVKR